MNSKLIRFGLAMLCWMFTSCSHYKTSTVPTQFGTQTTEHTQSAGGVYQNDTQSYDNDPRAYINGTSAGQDMLARQQTILNNATHECIATFNPGNDRGRFIAAWLCQTAVRTGIMPQLDISILAAISDERLMPMAMWMQMMQRMGVYGMYGGYGGYNGYGNNMMPTYGMPGSFYTGNPRIGY